MNTKLELVRLSKTHHGQSVDHHGLDGTAGQLRRDVWVKLLGGVRFSPRG